MTTVYVCAFMSCAFDIVAAAAMYIWCVFARVCVRKKNKMYINILNISGGCAQVKGLLMTA